MVMKDFYLLVEMLLKQVIGHTSQTHLVITYSIYKAIWKAKKIIASKDPHFTFHVTRHTCASEMANEQSENLKIITEYPGHRSLNTTTKYVHASLDEKNESFLRRMKSRGAAWENFLEIRINNTTKPRASRNQMTCSFKTFEKANEFSKLMVVTLLKRNTWKVQVKRRAK